MITKIIIGIVIYFLLLALICLFLKGATKNEREFEEHQEYERMKKLMEEENDSDDIEDFSDELDEDIRSHRKDGRQLDKN